MRALAWPSSACIPAHAAANRSMSATSRGPPPPPRTLLGAAAAAANARIQAVLGSRSESSSVRAAAASAGVGRPASS
eukprot:358763-Chlamydomonas_euryale.AAC.8